MKKKLTIEWILKDAEKQKKRMEKFAGIYYTRSCAIKQVFEKTGVDKETIKKEFKKKYPKKKVFLPCEINKIGVKIVLKILRMVK